MVCCCCSEVDDEVGVVDEKRGDDDDDGHMTFLNGAVDVNEDKDDLVEKEEEEEGRNPRATLMSWEKMRIRLFVITPRRDFMMGLFL